MRADRLLTLLLLLQKHGTLTARQLAEKLEVSLRTIYRDVDALCTAGVPIYAQSGPGGGFALLDSYRTSLTGLTTGEVRALFMLAVTEPLSELGVRDELRNALLKLSAALPVGHAGEEEGIRQRVYLDTSTWSSDPESLPYLATLYRAIWENRLVFIRFRLPHGLPAVLEQVVAPYGMVSKAGAWYCVYKLAGRLNARRVKELDQVDLRSEKFTRDSSFDLRTWWTTWQAEQADLGRRFWARVRIAPALQPQLEAIFGHLDWSIAADRSGWRQVELPFESFEAARSRVLGFGGAAEVLAPDALRLSVQDFARQISAVYEQDEDVSRHD